MRKIILTATLVSALIAPLAALAADADHGADLFDDNCSECHSVASAMRNKKGPSLYKVVGRHVASVQGFTYTPSLIQTNLTWNAQTLDSYLTNPKRLAPAGKMKFTGFAKAQDRADVIAFLMSVK
jgi:cytochrome c